MPDDLFIKEVELIQKVIDRMARNSFLIKGWTVTLVAVALLLKGGWHQVLIAFIPLAVFYGTIGALTAVYLIILLLI